MRSLFLFLSYLLISGALSGQNFDGGIYGGLVTSQMDGDGLSGFDKWGAQFGAYASIPLGDNSDVKLELAFLQKGSRQVPDSTNGFIQYRVNANYIEIPVLYRLRWNYLSFEVGPALDINVSQIEESQYIEVEPYADFNRFHLCGIFGINYHFSEHLYLNFRTNISITPARNISGARGPGFFPSLGGGGQRHVVLGTALVYDFGS